MAIQYLTDIDMNQNEIQNFVVQNISGNPSTSTEPGQVWFDTDANGLKVRLNSAIKRLLTDAFQTAGLVTGTNNWNPSSTISQDILLFKAGNAVSISKVSDPVSGYDAYQISSTDHTYDAGTLQQLEAGTDENNRVWQPKILHDYIATVVGAVDAMRFKGTLGTGGTITTLPTSGVRVGDTYMVITAGTYAGQVCEVGDLVIATATTPTWTVAQTNISGAITSISAETGSPITVTGSGASRTIGIGYTAVTGQPTRSPSLSFGESFTISQISQSTTGQITATDRTVTIPNTRADSAHDGLMSSTDKAKLDSMVKSTAIVGNPALTPSSGVCTWTITALNGMVAGTVQVFEKATGKQVMCEVAWLPVIGEHQEGDPNNYVRIRILSTSNIAADTYRAVIIGF